MGLGFCIVGQATDGPSGEVFQISSEKDLNRFGANWTERFSVSATASSVALSYEPFLLPVNFVDGLVSQLYSPYFDSTNYYFGAFGSTGFTLDLTYTPYLGKSDLIYAAKKYQRETGEWPAVCRLGGTKATLSVGNYEFESVFAGEKYNSLVVTWDTSGFVISGMEPYYPTLTYSASDAFLQRQLYKDVSAGISPIYCTQIGSSFPNIGISLSGGTDGSTSDQSQVEDWFDQLDLPYSVTHVLFLGPLGSALVNGVTDFNTRPRNLPRLWFTGTPDFYEPIEQYFTDVYSAVPYRNNLLVATLGTVTSLMEGRSSSRYAAEATAIAFSKFEGYNLTNLKLNVTDFSPVLGEDDLDLAKSQGFTSLMRYIGNDVSLYQGSTTLAERSFQYSSKVVEVWAIALNRCFQYLGTSISEGQHPEIENVLRQDLSGIKFFSVQEVSINVVHDFVVPSSDTFGAYVNGGSIMEVFVSGDLPDEILEISFNVVAS